MTRPPECTLDNVGFHSSGDLSPESICPAGADIGFVPALQTSASFALALPEHQLHARIRIHRNSRPCETA